MRTNPEYYTEKTRALVHEAKDVLLLVEIAKAIRDASMLERCLTRIKELHDAALWSLAISNALAGDASMVRRLITNPPNGTTGRVMRELWS